MESTTKDKPGKDSKILLVFKICLGIFLLLLLAWAINLGWHAIHLYRLAREIQNDPAQIQVATLSPMVDGAAGDIAVIHNQLKPLFPIFNLLEGVPGIGSYLGQVEPLLIYVDGLAQAGKEVLAGLSPMLGQASTGEESLTLPERASLALQSGQSHFIAAEAQLGRATTVRYRIHPELIPGSLRSMYLKLDGRFELIVAGVRLLQVAPQLMGAAEVQNYLVLAQNRDELRATGGFISGIGLLSLQDGKITRFDLGDSYAVDDFSKPYPTPPEPLKRFMLADYWVTRDANWSPDFPTSAQQAQNLYALSTGNQTQGVIAFNQLALRGILQVIGPVQVPGTDGPVNADNVVDYMRQAWAPAPEQGLSTEWWLHRKDFMQLLGGVLLEKVLSSADQKQLFDLAKVIVDLLERGQLLVYFNDSRAQAILHDIGWDGAVHPGGSDYLYLVDSNVGFNKVDSVIQRTLVYHVDLRDTIHPQGEVTITYTHTGNGNLPCKQEISYGSGTYQDMIQRCYLDYWRIYAPGGSGVISTTAVAVPPDELLNGVGWSGGVESQPGEAGTQVFAGLIMVPVASTSQVSIAYSLPLATVINSGPNIKEYDLHVQVQPGLEGLPFELEVTLPTNATLLDPAEGWKPSGSTTWKWSGVLDKSTHLNLQFQTGAPP